jgi:hypothetical protein
MATVVTSLFRSRLAAESAVDSLMRLGFRRDEISMLMTDNTQGREFGIVTQSKAGEGAAAGAAAGGTLGAIVATLAAVGTLMIPGLGFVAAGPIVAALAGAGAGGAAGTLVGALVGAGIPEHEAKFYGPGVEQGGILVGVHVTDASMVEAAKAAFRTAGGDAPHTTSEVSQ